MVGIKGQTAAELEARFKDWGEPLYRVSQLLEWLYVRRVVDWNQMSNLPKALREKLAAEFTLAPLQFARTQGSRDTTLKFLWRLADGSFIESVLIPANPALYGEGSDRHTLCVSTQVGCAYGCRFCASGLDGWKRNLEPDEIVEQVLVVERWHSDERDGRAGRKLALPLDPSPPGEGKAESGSGLTQAEEGHSALGRGGGRLVSNLVIMGMGEPLANYENLLTALRILNASWGGGIGARKITISTSGLVPQIRMLADEPLQFRLAISLHGATDETRNKIMPVNRKYPLRDLVGACEYYQKKKGRMITLEYILIAGVNDQPGDARALAVLAGRLNAKVNLIPYNTVEGLPWERPEEAVQEGFLNTLTAGDIIATLRREKGHDIDAACGQLRLRTERELAGKG